MDSLPIELLHLIFEFCDPASVRALRLQSRTFADIGYAYLLPPVFNVLPWRDDLTRLRAIAGHPHLHENVRAITFNFTDIHLENARHAAYYQNYLLGPECQTALLNQTWKHYEQYETRRQATPDFSTRNVDDIAAALRPLTNLHHLAITFRRSPYDLEVLHRALALPECCKMDHVWARKTLILLLRALQQATAKTEDTSPTKEQPASQTAQTTSQTPPPRLTTFSVDRLPLEMFKQPSDRRSWFHCGDVLGNLTRLDLAFDTSNTIYPSARFKAANGLGYTLRLAPQLTHLSLAFHNYVQPGEKFTVSFLELLGDGSFGYIKHLIGDPPRPSTLFLFKKLTDLKLEGIACDERELGIFLLRHAATLERLRLGGRGMARSTYEPPNGGITLFNGNFRRLFRRLRGRMLQLQRLHLEGDFQCETSLSGPNSSADDDNGHPAGNLTFDSFVNAHARYERYIFYPITDDNWAPTPQPPRPPPNGVRNSANFEKYVLGITDEYPDLSGS